MEKEGFKKGWEEEEEEVGVITIQWGRPAREREREIGTEGERERDSPSLDRFSFSVRAEVADRCSIFLLAADVAEASPYRGEAGRINSPWRSWWNRTGRTGFCRTCWEDRATRPVPTAATQVKIKKIKKIKKKRQAAKVEKLYKRCSEIQPQVNVAWTARGPVIVHLNAAFVEGKKAWKTLDLVSHKTLSLKAFHLYAPAICSWCYSVCVCVALMFYTVVSAALKPLVLCILCFTSWY